MKNILHSALNNFFVHMVGIELEIKDIFEVRECYISKIELKGDINYDAYLFSTVGFLQKMSSIFLFIDDPDEDTLKDLNNEMLNIVIGNAKCIYSEIGTHFAISTPKFIGIGEKLLNLKEISFSSAIYESEEIKISLMERQ